MQLSTRTMNGAPDFKQGADKDAVVLDVREKNIDKTMPDYAYNPLAQTPYTMLFINADVVLEYIPKSMKTKGCRQPRCEGYSRGCLDTLGCDY